jgi:PAS domain S-box-containing protein
VSAVGTDELKKLQQRLLQQAKVKTNEIFNEEKRAKNRTLILLILVLLFVTGIGVNMIRIITKMLTELKVAALRISRGAAGSQNRIVSHDVIGSLAQSISKIDNNNKLLANAADAIGEGNFNVIVQPRSPDDLLGNAIVRMKDNLQRFTQEKEEGKEQFRQLADFMPQIVWTARPDGFLDYYNKRWYEFTGFDEGYGDQSWAPILHPDDVQLCMDTWYYSVQTGQPYQIEYRFKDRITGGYKWFLGKALPVKDSEGKISKWFGTCTEIQNQKMLAEELEQKVKERTYDLKQTNAELERSNKDLEQFAYVASHDLQEPVRKIRTFAEFIKDKSFDSLDEQSKSYLDKICLSADRMRNIIKDILNFSHLNKEKDQFERTDLNKILYSVKSDLELVIAQKGALIHSDSLPVIEALPVQMNQLFYNLINNALKFSIPGQPPVVTISSRALDKKEALAFSGFNSSLNYIQINFSDNGIGFDQKYAQHIFTMFQRLNDRGSYSGTGIGLALCKKIADNHKGYIDGQSKPDEGATFRVLLPTSQSGSF